MRSISVAYVGKARKQDTQRSFLAQVSRVKSWRSQRGPAIAPPMHAIVGRGGRLTLRYVFSDILASVFSVFIFLGAFLAAACLAASTQCSAA
jgi:hypothetical protein